jgi:hypothetical protein
VKLYRCLVRGENFPGQLVGKKGLVGFYTTRWVEAVSLEDAEMSALEAMRIEPTLEIVSPKLREQSKAMVYFEEILEVPSETPRVPSEGATWFDM